MKGILRQSASLAGLEGLKIVLNYENDLNRFSDNVQLKHWLHKTPAQVVNIITLRRYIQKMNLQTQRVSLSLEEWMGRPGQAAKQRIGRQEDRGQRYC